MSIKISPSLLSADMNNIEEEVKLLCNAGANFLHVDVMDGNFVESICMTPYHIQKIKSASSVPLDVHLMINNPIDHCDSFITLGADIITIHVESFNWHHEIVSCIKHIKSANNKIKVGISLKPHTKITKSITNLIQNHVDLVLVMTVEPGAAGQKFLESQLSKIKDIRRIVSNLDHIVEISVDGGINDTTSKMCIDAGATVLVSGSYVFSEGQNLYKQKISNLCKT